MTFFTKKWKIFDLTLKECWIPLTLEISRENNYGGQIFAWILQRNGVFFGINWRYSWRFSLSIEFVCNEISDAFSDDIFWQRTFISNGSKAVSSKHWEERRWIINIGSYLPSSTMNSQLKRCSYVMCNLLLLTLANYRCTCKWEWQTNVTGWWFEFLNSSLSTRIYRQPQRSGSGS